MTEAGQADLYTAFSTGHAIDEDHSFRLTKQANATVLIKDDSETRRKLIDSYCSSLVPLRSGLLGNLDNTVEEVLPANKLARFFLDIRIGADGGTGIGAIASRARAVLVNDWLRPEAATAADEVLLLRSPAFHRIVFPNMVVAWQTFPTMVEYVLNALMHARRRYDYFDARSLVQFAPSQHVPYSSPCTRCKHGNRVCSGCNGCQGGLRFDTDLHFSIKAKSIHPSDFVDVGQECFAEALVFGASAPKTKYDIPYNVSVSKTSGKPPNKIGEALVGNDLILCQRKFGEFIRQISLPSGDAAVRHPYKDVHVTDITKGSSHARIRIRGIGINFCSTCGKIHADGLTWFKVDKKAPTKLIQMSTSKEVDAGGRPCLKKPRVTYDMSSKLAARLYATKGSSSVGSLSIYTDLIQTDATERSLGLDGFSEYTQPDEDTERLCNLVAFVRARAKENGYTINSAGYLYRPLFSDDKMTYFHSPLDMHVREYVCSIADQPFIVQRTTPSDHTERLVSALVRTPDSSLPRLAYAETAQVSFSNGVFDMVMGCFFPLDAPETWDASLEEAKRIHSGWQNHKESIFDVDKWKVPQRSESTLSYHDVPFDEGVMATRTRFGVSAARICDLLREFKLDITHTTSFASLPVEAIVALERWLRETVDTGFDESILRECATPLELQRRLWVNPVSFLGTTLFTKGVGLDAETGSNLLSLIGRSFFTRPGMKGYDDYQICLFLTGNPVARRTITALFVKLIGGVIYRANSSRFNSENFPFQGMTREARHVLFENVPHDGAVNVSVFQSMVSQEAVRLAQKNSAPISFNFFDKIVSLTGHTIPCWEDSGGALTRRIVQVGLSSFDGRTQVDMARLAVALSFAYMQDLTFTEGGSWLQMCGSGLLKKHQLDVCRSVQPLRAHLQSDGYVHMTDFRGEKAFVLLDDVKRRFNFERRQAGLKELSWTPSLYEPVFADLNLEIEGKRLYGISWSEAV